jgi:hypothetical protein
MSEMAEDRITPSPVPPSSPDSPVIANIYPALTPATPTRKTLRKSLFGTKIPTSKSKKRMIGVKKPKKPVHEMTEEERTKEEKRFKHNAANSKSNLIRSTCSCNGKTCK